MANILDEDGNNLLDELLDIITDELGIDIQIELPRPIQRMGLSIRLV